MTLEFPQGEDVPSYLQGGHEWRWTAHFEAFASNFDTIEGSRATPEGTYRFVVDGLRRAGRRRPSPTTSSRGRSRSRAWDGITVEDLDVRRERARRASTVGPRRNLTVIGAAGPRSRPRSGRSTTRTATPRRSASSTTRGRRSATRPRPRSASKLEWYCFRCSFRPWADVGPAETAYVTIVRPDGSSERMRAVEGSPGSFSSERALSAGETAFVAAGDVRDAFGNVNGADSGSVERRSGTESRFLWPLRTQVPRFVPGGRGHPK